jgi:hypothetical protein
MFREITRPETQEHGFYTQSKPQILENVNVDKTIDIDTPLVSKQDEESSVLDDIFEGLLCGLIDCVDLTVRDALEEQHRNK